MKKIQGLQALHGATLKEGASLNRSPLFVGEHFSFWKKKMKIFIQSIDPSAWNAIFKGPFIPTKEANGELVPKECDEMKDDEKRKVQDNQKAKNILTFGLSSDEFFHTARCKGAKVQSKFRICLKSLMKAQWM